MNSLDYKSAFNRSIDWLLYSFHINNNNGSSGWQSRTFHPFRGWSLPYPETTGYILVTLYDLLNDGHYREDEINGCIKSSISWLLNLQLEIGAFPGGHGKYPNNFRLNSIDYIFNRKRKSMPSIFNTGQILRGLVRAYEDKETEILYISIKHATNYLCDSINNDGSWKNDAYAGQSSPSYFSYIAKPILDSSNILQNEKSRELVLKSLYRIIEKSNNTNDFIKSMSFPRQEIIHTHTLSYTIQGLLECLDFYNNDIKNKTMQISNKIISKLLKFNNDKGFIPGGVYGDFRPDLSYSCLTGNCQIGLILLEMNDISKNQYYFDCAKNILDYTINNQSKNGSIAGSYPFWGKYMSMRNPNWAVKYYLDLHSKINRVTKL